MRVLRCIRLAVELQPRDVPKLEQPTMTGSEGVSL